MTQPVDEMVRQVRSRLKAVLARSGTREAQIALTVCDVRLARLHERAETAPAASEQIASLRLVRGFVTGLTEAALPPADLRAVHSTDALLCVVERELVAQRDAALLRQRSPFRGVFVGGTWTDLPPPAFQRREAPAHGPR